MAKFKYKKREASSYEKRAHQSASSRDEVLDPKFKQFNPKEGDNLIRILPPTWEDADHYGFEIFVHYMMGMDKNQYLSLAKMKGVPDPIQEEKMRAEQDGDTEYARQLNPAKRILVWIIDRDNEKEGPQLWAMPWTVDRDLCNRARDKRTGAVYHIDDPEEGYDISFTKTGKGIGTKYEAIDIARNTSPIHDEDRKFDDWLEYITDNPLPDTLLYHDYEHIEGIMKGHVRRDDDDDNKDKAKDTKGSRDTGSKRSKKVELPTYDDLQEMSMDDLDALCEEHDVDIFGDDFDGESEFAAEIAKRLNIKPARRERKEPEDEKPARRARKGKDEEPEEKPSRRSSRAKDEDDEPKESARSSRRAAKDDDEPEEKPSRRSSKDEEPEEKSDDTPARRLRRRA